MAVLDLFAPRSVDHAAPTSRKSLLALDATEREAPLAGLREDIRRRLAAQEDAPARANEVGAIVAGLRATGHDICRHDDLNWGGNAAAGASTGQLAIQFKTDGQVVLEWA